jgi:hypothetical protein
MLCIKECCGSNCVTFSRCVEINAATGNRSKAVWSAALRHIGLSTEGCASIATLVLYLRYSPVHRGQGTVFQQVFHMGCC